MAKKQDLPAMPFYVGDWLKCPEVKVLPPDIRGLWFDMICYMWESVERGVMVKPNHHPYAKEEIIRMIGKDCSDSGAWIDTLIDNGVCSIRENDNAIFSRRMVKDEDIRRKRQQSGRKGGEVTKERIFKPKNQGTVPEPPGDNPPPTPPPLSPEEQARADKAKKYKYADFVTLTRDEYAKLCEEYSEDGAKAMIEILNNYKGSKGKKYKSDYLTIRGWVKDKYYEDLQKNGTSKAKPNIPTPESGVQRDYEESFR
ncbi:MAG: hypothetical protein RRZ64_00300 [Rikenellaceae bacterium]